MALLNRIAGGVFLSAALAAAGARRRPIRPRMSAWWCRSRRRGRPTSSRALSGRSLRTFTVTRSRSRTWPAPAATPARRRPPRRPADGYTLLVISTGFMVNPSLYARVPYDPMKEFAPITLVAASPNVLVVNPEVPAKSVKELIALIKANPGKYSYAQPALGSTPHLGGELFKLTFNLDLAMVPFPGAAPAITSTIGGHTPIAFTALPPAITAAKDGKVRALAVMAEKRVGVAAGCADHGGGGRPGPGGRHAHGHRRAGRHAEGHRRPIAARHRQDRRAAGRQSKARRARLSHRSPTRRCKFATQIKAEMEKWGKVVRAANLKIE